MTNVHVRRPLQINLHALLQQSNPTIDLGVQSYESTTRNFLKAVTNYKNRAMAAIDERRKHQVQEKKKVLDRITVVENETAQCKVKEIELVARMLSTPVSYTSNFYHQIGSSELEREKEERKDAELTVAAFKRQLAALKDKAASAEADIEQYRAIVQNLRRGWKIPFTPLLSHIPNS